MKRLTSPKSTYLQRSLFILKQPAYIFNIMVLLIRNDVLLVYFPCCSIIEEDQQVLLLPGYCLLHHPIMYIAEKGLASICLVNLFVTIVQRLKKSSLFKTIKFNPDCIGRLPAIRIQVHVSGL
jgi:hypothetical protein